MRLLDVHCHYEDSRFDADRTAVLEAVAEKGIIAIDAGCSVRDSRRVCEYAEAYPNLYFCAGIHPENAAEFSQSALEELQALWRHEKCVGAGEIGLDYYWDKEPQVQENQRYWFKRQLELAKEKDLPVIIHSRDAAEDTMQILKETPMREMPGVIHCYSYSVEMAREFLKMGYDIGVGGVLTFKNAKKLRAVVEEIPLERILLETDCPYMAPEPHRGERNSSLFIPYVVEKIAEIKNISTEEVLQTTNANAKKLFARVK